MLNQLKNILNDPGKKTIVHNYISLSLLQAGNYLLPLLTFPYLVRVLGIEKFGIIAFAQAIISYFIILTDFGFDLSATKNISINRNNAKKVSEIVSYVMFTRFFLTIIAFILLCLIIVLFKDFRNEYKIYLFTFTWVAGQVLFPTFFFQGMEAMKFIMILNFTAKLISTLSIFLFIQNASHYLYVPLIHGLGFCIAGIISLFLLFYVFKIRFIKPQHSQSVFYLKEGWNLFLSRVFVSLYTSTNTIILGLLTNPIMVGYYNICEKVIGIFTNLIGMPINQTVYPYLANIYFNSRLDFNRISNKILMLLFFLLLTASLLIFLFAEQIIFLIAGTYIPKVAFILRIIGFIVVLSPLGAFYTQVLVIQEKSKMLMKIIFFASILNLMLIFPSIKLFSLTGMVSTIIIVQIFIISFILIHIKRKT